MKKFPLAISLAVGVTLMALAFPGSGFAATAQPGDGWILTALAFVMERDGRLSLGRVNASCHHGVVVLRGIVPTEEDKGVAEQLAMLIPGVQGIENDLAVARAGDRDARVAQEVRSMLIDDPAVRIKGLDVRARDGIVTLTGTVDDQRQRRLADWLVMMAPEALGVEDRLTTLRAV